MAWSAGACDADSPMLPEDASVGLGGGPDSADSNCVDDRFGRGVPELVAASLGAGTYTDLVLCEGVADWFRIEASSGDRIEVSAAFDSDGGRANDAPALALWSNMTAVDRAAEGRVPTRAVMTSSGERIRLEVGPSADRSRSYRISVLVTPSAACDDDIGRSVEDARTLPPGAHGGWTVCRGVSDWFRLEAAPGDEVSVAVDALSDTALMVALHATSGTVEVDRKQVPASGTAEIFGVVPEGGLWLSVSTSDAASVGRYAVRFVRRSPAATNSVVIRFRLRTPDRPLARDGFGPTVWTPAGGLRYDIVRASDGARLQFGVTDAEGRIDAVVTRDTRDAITVRVLSIATVGWVDVEVVGPGDLPWAIPLRTLAPDDESWVPETPIELTLDERLAGALHVAATMRTALLDVEPHLPPIDFEPPSVVVRWSPDRASGCGTCFRPNPNPLIELSGREIDPDEWDDDVLRHELAHYVAAVFSRDDSPGGAHDGRPTLPALAWSEGFADFHAAWLGNSPTLLDARVTGVRVVDVEAADDVDAFGTADDTIEGRVSERLVTAILWDLYDHPAQEDDDPAALAIDVVLAPLFGPMRTLTPDVGAAGADLADYLAALLCGPTRFDAAWAVVDSRDFPYESEQCERGKDRGALRLKRRGAVVVVESRSRGQLTVMRGEASMTGWIEPGEVVRWTPPSDPSIFVGATLESGRSKEVAALRWEPRPRPSLATRRRAGAVELVMPQPSRASHSK